MIKFMSLRSAAICLASALMAAMLFAGAAGNTAYAQAKPNRLALIVGNSNYASDRLLDLPNAANDATRLADALKRLNFDVALGTDFTSSQFEDLFEQYQAKLAQYDAVLIFYAGHGVQFNGENYILPVDTPDPVSVENLIEPAVKLDDVIDRFASRNRQTFIFLDACRNNPLGLRAPGTNNGLAQFEVGDNTFVAFATQPGNVTVDGKGENSPFTTSLLDHVEIPGPSVSDMMIKVRNGTAERTLGRQVPWDQSNLREQFYFTEQQVLDPQQLSSMLSQILAKPEMKAKLVDQLASTNSDLQSAVLVLGRELPDTRSASIEPSQVVPAALELGLDAAHKEAVSNIASLLVLGEPTPADTSDTAESADGAMTGGQPKPTITLEHRTQTELKRVGCYRQTVDGVWGPGSRKALGNYLAITKQSQADLQPNADVLTDLFLRSGRICREPEPAPRALAIVVQTVEKVVVQKQACSCQAPRQTRVRQPAVQQPPRTVRRQTLTLKDPERADRGSSNQDSSSGSIEAAVPLVVAVAQVAVHRS